MRVVILGGSSWSTPALFDSDEPLQDARIELAGRNQSNLRAVLRASEIVSAARGGSAAISIARFDDLDTSLAGADVVIVQVRAGGYAARAWDESFPHAYDLCGDEGLGPGGLAAAWRTWPIVRDLLAHVERNAPGALVLLLTSPVGILSRLAIEGFANLRINGICELPWTTLEAVCAAHNAAVADASYCYAGVNHLGWFSGVCDGGGALLCDGPVALKYVRLHDEPAAVLAEQRASGSRGRELDRLATRAFETYANGDPAAVLATVRSRLTPWYAQAVAPLLAALESGASSSRTYFLTTRNRDYLDFVGPDEVAELPFTLSGGQFARRPRDSAVPSGIAATLSRFTTYERAAADAVRDRNEAGIATALACHPWLAEMHVPPALVRDVLAQTDAAAATVNV